jgi:hypothetical protein
MKNYFPSLLPALALLTLGSCAGTTALSSSETDGIYYSSQDRTTRNARAAASATQPTESASGDDITNPEYNGQDNSSSSAAAGGTEYYDDDYAYSSRIRRFHQPYYRGFGYGYNDFVFADPFWYGGPAYYSAWGPAFGGFYDPFWGPNFFGGSYVSIHLGFGNPYWGWGRPWGWNRWGWGGGYGRGFYDGYYSGLYGGGFGYGGFGGTNYYYGGNGGTGTVRNVRYGPRNSRSAEATTGGRAATSRNTVSGGRGRVNEGGIVAPGGTTTTNGVVGNNPGTLGRRDARAVDVATDAAPTTASPTIRGGRERVRVMNQSTDQITTNQNAPDTRYQRMQDAATETPAPTPTRSYEGRRWRVAQETGSGDQPASAPVSDYSRPRRRSIFNSDQSGSDQSAEQPVRRQARQRTYEAPQRSYEAPQRSYEAPQRSYEAPQRSYEAPQRSYSPPSGGGGSRGGGRGRVN